MSFFSQLKLILGKYLYRRKLKGIQRTRKVYNLNEAHTIGILYDATDKEDHERIKNFIKTLKDQNKRVISLGFVNTKYPNYLLHPKLELRFFTVKETNWLAIPACTEAKNFIEEEFHILIDLNVGNCFPLQYICGLSKANFKVGITSNDPDVYDMMLHIEKKKTMENLITQSIHYLQMINKPVSTNS